MQALPKSSGQRELVGMVGCDHKQRVVKPRLLGCVSEERTQGMVAIPNTRMDGLRTFGEHTFIALGYSKRMMAGGREDGGHERFLHRAHLLAIELQKLLIPDSPCAVVIAFGLRIFIHTVILLEGSAAGVCLKTHTAVRRTVEEGRGVSFASQTIRYR